MPEAKPKRKFWQFHLSTAVLLTLCVGVALGVLIRYARAPILIPEEFVQNPTAVNNIIIRANGLRFVRILVVLPLILLLLLLVGMISEWLIHRREARKT